MRDDTNSVAKSVAFTDDFSIPAVHIASARAAGVGSAAASSSPDALFAFEMFLSNLR